MTKIYHAHLYGNRESKYEWLLSHDVSSTTWTELAPQKPFHLFIPQNNDLLGEYQACWKITEVMPSHVYGFKSHRDHYAIDFTKDTLIHKITDLVNADLNDPDFSKKYKIGNWNWKQASKELGKEENIWEYLELCGYRPFDNRFMFYSDSIMDRARPELRKHIFKKQNLCLICSRQISTLKYCHFFITNLVPNDCLISNITKESNYDFPLYLYPDNSNSQQSTEIEHRRPNFSPDFLKDITGKLGYTPTPEAIFYYIYGIFHAPTYRSRYAEFLKIDFPRVPLTSNDELFRQLSAYGEELVALHLMKSPKLDTLITQFVEAEGNCTVDPGHPKYDESSSSVLINKKGDKFTGVPNAVWEFYVGGYQVCHKWLKDRKGRTLSLEDIVHYQRIVVALQETMSLMQQIDAAIPGWPLE
ncbi:MAG: type ISP restriction/modification enzyme [Microcoleaceae cyanobacterium]